MPRDRESILDMLNSIRLVMQYVSGLEQRDFEANDQCQDAVIRRIEIMGEAAKRVAETVRQRFPQVPWHEMAGMRDRVIHSYDTVDVEIVWDTIRRDLPTLAGQLQSVLESDELDSTGSGE